MKKNLKSILIFALLFGCCFVKPAFAEDYPVTELRYSRVGGAVTIFSETLYQELLEEENPIARPEFLAKFNFTFGKRFRPVLPPMIKEATILVGNDEYPAQLTVSHAEKNVVILTAAYLDFYTKPGIEFFPCDVRIEDESGKIITLTGIDFSSSDYGIN
ncbi:MAG: hypothetical protein V1770_05210 [bacterium]